MVFFEGGFSEKPHRRHSARDLANFSNMPSADFNTVTTKPVLENEDEIARTRCTKPLINHGVLDQYVYSDLTPIIGRVFNEKVQMKEFLSSDNPEELFNDLALTSMFTTDDIANLGVDKWISIRSWCGFLQESRYYSRANEGNYRENI